MRGLRLFLCLAFATVISVMTPPVSAADRLPEFLAEIEPGALVPGADRFGDVEGSPPVTKFWALSS